MINKACIDSLITQDFAMPSGSPVEPSNSVTLTFPSLGSHYKSDLLWYMC